MKGDLQNRDDIYIVISDFYSRAVKDSEIKHHFKSLVEKGLEKHFPKVCDFWEMILFGSSRYTENIIQKHIQLDQKNLLQEEHFEKWLKLFKESISNVFEGKKADEMIKRAEMMKELMSYKVVKSRDSDFIK